MSTSATAVQWWQHPTTRKWHAYLPDAARSLCDYTTRRTDVLPAPGCPAPWVCDVCHRKLAFGPLPPGLVGCNTPVDQRPPAPAVIAPVPGPGLTEEMLVEFVGGAFDGGRVLLRIIRAGELDYDVLPGRYTRKPPVRTSTVEAP